MNQPWEAGQTAPGVQQNVSGSGSIAANLSGGSQLHVGDLNVLADSQYSNVKVDDYGPTTWVNPPQSHELMKVLWEHRLLILAGDLEEKTDCARQIAYLLRAKLEPGTLVRERCPGREPQRIETAFDEKHQTIVLLPEVSPLQIVGYSPRQTRELLRLHKAFAIITTDCNRSDWQIEERSLEASLFRELAWERYYGARLLGDFLTSELRDLRRPAIPDGILPETNDALLVEGMSIEEAAALLQTPGRVRSLAEWIFASQTPPTKAMLVEQVARLSGDEDAVRRWFRQLTERDQLLALGLALFDGLEDATLFEGLEFLVETCWRATDPLLHQFDYCDLERFSAYFKQIPIDGGLMRIESSSPERRRQIFEIVWSVQRRRLLAALPALTEMIRNSAASNEPEAEPNELPPGRDSATTEQAARQAPNQPNRRPIQISNSGASQLHQSLVDSLSLIRLLSVETVEPYLRVLASDRSPGIQRFVARALAAWHEKSPSVLRAGETQPHKSLCDLLADWWSAACRAGADYSVAERLSRRGAYDVSAALRTTIALTVGFAAKYDPPNGLANELCLLIRRLLDDLHPRVREQMLAWTVPLATAFHFVQIADELQQRLLWRDDLMKPVARGAALACALRPDESLAILVRWKAAAQDQPPKCRERLLGAVALTYGYIECEATGPLSPEAILGNLRSLLEEERYPDVRYWMFSALEQQARGRFDTVAALLQDFLAVVTVRDRPLVVRILTATYLSQREALGGGDEEIEVDGKTFAVSTRSARPLTEIEASLYSWMLDESHPIAQQIAVEVFAALGLTTLERTERERRNARQQSPVFTAAQLSPPLPEPQSYSTPLLGRLALRFATRRKPHVRPILKPLLAELIVVGGAPLASIADPSRHERIETLFARWAGVSSKATQAIGRFLQSAFTLYRWRWGLILAGAFLALLLYQLVPPFVGYLETPPSPSIAHDAASPARDNPPAAGTDASGGQR